MPTEKKVIRVMPVIRAYGKAVLEYPWLLVWSVVGVIGLESANVLAPLYMRQFINILSASTPDEFVVKSLFITLLIFAGINFCGWIAQRIRMTSITIMESQVMRDLSNTAFDYLLGHSHDFFISNFAGTLTRRVNRYARSFEQVFDSFILTFLPTALFTIGTIVVLSMRSLVLGLGLLVWTVTFFFLQYYLTKWRQGYKLVRSAEDSKVTGILSDAVANHTTITLFASKGAEGNYFGSAIERWMKANLASWHADNLVYSVQGLFSLISEAGLLAVAVYLWSKGILTVGDFVLIQVYILGLMNRIWDIGHTLRRLNDSFADASEMVDILEQPHEVSDIPTATELSVTDGKIEFKDVEFNFNETRSILNKFSLNIRGGEKVALVGPSGAGKSTITKLLLRLHEVTGGEITIDGQNIKEVQQESLRRAIGFVPQESILFHRTLRDNILYGKPDATKEELIEASKKAHAHDFISQLPLGYDTFVGERGVKLSGGERQRVAIARALLKNAPILVLDEATSSLDSESEHLIQEALDTLMEGKTVIVIAHRLSTIMKMDRIVVMEQGAIASQGTHDELLKEDGLYAKLWSIQAGGFLGGPEEPKESEEVEQEVEF
ncbi:MAG: ABC transporter ATP-binding protein [Patescibacteria group bacterium]